MSDSTTSTFRTSLEETLKHYNDLTWLATNSPFAAPYLLAQHLPTAASNDSGRVQALRTLLQNATSELSGKYADRSQAILREYYFRNRSVDIVCDEIGLGRDAFHTSRKRAIDSLAEVLIEKLQPALLLEAVPQTTLQFFDREPVIQECLTALRAKKTVAIMGSGGSGKTTLGSHLAQRWGVTKVFWYTIRPGFSDYLDVFLFQLAHFLRTQGAAILWQELTASAGKIDLRVVPGVLRHALSQCQQPPLLCLDEVDLLNPTQQGDHAQLIALLQPIGEMAPLLLLGQQVTIEANHFVTLANLSPPATNQWLQESNIKLRASEQHQLHTFTDGNPRLLQLFIILHEVGEPLTGLLAQLTATPSLENLLGRILQRLGETERSLLIEIAVASLSGGAPLDSWHNETASNAIQHMLNRQLLHTDGQGRIWLLPAYAVMIEQQLPDEKRKILHDKVANLFAERGQYTTATYHYTHGNNPEQAVWLWRDYQQQEINQGQASRASAIFNKLLEASLSPATHEQATLLCARLERIRGNMAQAQDDLRTILFKTPIFAAEAAEMAGFLANEMGDLEEAERHFRKGLAHAEQVVAIRGMQLHKGLGWRHMLERQLDAAWREAMLAQVELENFMGNVQEEYCEYPQAETHYHHALHLAQTHQHQEGIAKSCNSLSGLYARLGRFAEANSYWQEAEEAYQRLGKSLALAGNQLNLGFISNLAGDHPTALCAAQRAPTLLIERNITPSLRFNAIAHQIMAEAHLGLHRLNEAEEKVKWVIASEELSLLPDAYRTYGEVLLQRGQHNEAIKHTKFAIDLAQQNQDRYLEAYAWRVVGRIHQASSQITVAHEAFTNATRLFTSLKLVWECEKM